MLENMNLSCLAQNHSSMTRLKQFVYRCQVYNTTYFLPFTTVIGYSLKVGTGTTFSGTKSGTKFKLLFLYLCEHFIKISKIKWKEDNFIYKIESTLLQLILFILLIMGTLSMPVLVGPDFHASPGPF